VELQDGHSLKSSVLQAGQALFFQLDVNQVLFVLQFLFLIHVGRDYLVDFLEPILIGEEDIEAFIEGFGLFRRQIDTLFNAELL